LDVLAPNGPAGPPDDDGDLALVVQPLAPLGADDGAAVRIERGDGLVEVRGRRAELRSELLDPAAVVQVDTDDLGGDDGRKMNGVSSADPTTVAGDQVVAVAHRRDGSAVQQDPSGLHPLSPWDCRMIGSGFVERQRAEELPAWPS